MTPRARDLVTINDALWSSDEHETALLNAVGILRDLVGAKLTPVYLYESTGQSLMLSATPQERAVVRDAFERLPAKRHAREPWVTEAEVPVLAEDHLADGAWQALPAEFRDWFDATGIVVPLVADGLHLGDILLTFEDPRRPGPEELDFLNAAGRMIAGAVYRWRRAVRYGELAALQERRRLSDELHDDIAQQVAALALRASAANNALTGGTLEVTAELLEELEEAAESLRRTLRYHMLGLRAEAASGDQPFVHAVNAIVEQFARFWGVPTSFERHAPTVESFPLTIRSRLLRIIQEGLTNIGQHAQAEHAALRLLPTADGVRLEIEDDGRGFVVDEVPEHRLGLQILRSRVEEIHGTLRVTSAPGEGTLLSITVPIGRQRPLR